ncbi:MAG: GNAT family N-acetyltransferase [Planctomycetota bacterium]
MTANPGERLGVVTLRPVTPENVAAVVKLRVAPGQDGLVATNSNSLAEAYVYPDRAWPRAIYAGDTPVGFLMLDLVGPDHPEVEEGRASYYLWRLMVDAEHQGKGYGAAGVRLAIEHVKTLPDARELKSSYVPKDGSAAAFYERLGFKPTGEVDDGEVVIRLDW